jgi:hypothetical protein
MHANNAHGFSVQQVVPKPPNNSYSERSYRALGAESVSKMRRSVWRAAACTGAHSLACLSIAAVGAKNAIEDAANSTAIERGHRCKHRERRPRKALDNQRNFSAAKACARSWLHRRSPSRGAKARQSQVQGRQLLRQPQEQTLQRAGLNLRDKLKRASDPIVHVKHSEWAAVGELWPALELSRGKVHVLICGAALRGLVHWTISTRRHRAQADSVRCVGMLPGEALF